MTEPEPTTRPPSAAKALAVYNLQRLGLFAGCLGLAYAAGLRSFLLLVVALLASGALSWYALRPQRIRASLAVEAAVGRSAGAQRVASPVRRRRAAMRDRVAAEDAYVDQLHAQDTTGVIAPADGQASDAPR
jgi:hypothetical protein